MKRYFLLTLVLLLASPFSQAAIAPVTPITQNFSGLIEQVDFNSDGQDDLSISVQDFEISHAGEVSIAGSAVGIQWFLLVFDGQGNLLANQQYFAHFAAPTATLALDAGAYRFAIGGFLFGEDQVDLGYTSNKTLAEVGFTGGANNITWNVTVISPGLEVPLPAALPLFMSSLLGVIAIGRRRRA